MIYPRISRPSPKPKARVLVSLRIGILENENGDVLFRPVTRGEVEIEEKR